MFAPASSYTEDFEREHGFTEAEWLAGMPRAVGAHVLSPGADPGEATVAIGPGQLHLCWTVLPPRAIARIRMPRLWVRYRFHEVPVDERIRFMRFFDLVMQRGGG